MITDKEEAKLFAFWMLLFLAIGWFGGWVYAHYTVADECRKLGKFYVGKTVFECKAITEKEGDGHA